MKKKNLTPYYIWLLSVMGVANPRTMRLISHFGGIEQTYDILNSNKHRFEFLKDNELSALKKASLDKSAELVEWCGKKGYGIVTFDDDDYCEQLRHIYNPPLVLFTQGNMKSILNDGIRVNIIGTRNPSEYSCGIASYISAELAKTGVTVISGMAVGLDKCAMSAAIENSGTVVGVLACGIDIEYPKGSGEFRQRIVENGGAILSELLPRDGTRPAYFHSRNRIMSGLASGTLIVEAPERSGCHITALHTVCQNRDLFCIPPHDILNPRYSGVVRYLRDGAIPVFSHIDIINEYITDISERLYDSDKDLSASHKVFEKDAKDVRTVTEQKQQTPKTQKNKNNVNSDNAASIPKFKIKPPTTQSPPKLDLSELTAEQAAVITALQKKPLTFDELVRKKLFAAEKAYEFLLDMELDGLIEKIAGDRYSIL